MKPTRSPLILHANCSTFSHGNCETLLLFIRLEKSCFKDDMMEEDKVMNQKTFELKHQELEEIVEKLSKWLHASFDSEKEVVVEMMMHMNNLSASIDKL